MATKYSCFLTASNKTKTQAIREQFFTKQPNYRFGSQLPSKKNIGRGLFANPQTETFNICKNENTSFAQGKRWETQKKKQIIKENITNQPFRTQYSYRSNAQEQAKLDKSEIPFWGESRTFGKKIERKKKQQLLKEPQSSRRLLWNGDDKLLKGEIVTFSFVICLSKTTTNLNKNAFKKVTEMSILRSHYISHFAKNQHFAAQNLFKACIFLPFTSFKS